MLVIKVMVNDGSVTIETAPWFTYDNETNEFRYIDSEGDKTGIDTKTATKVYVYTQGGMVIFTRDLDTMRPIGGYDV